MNTFQELSLNPPLMRAIADLGYDTPTPIQAQTLPILLAGDTDFLGLAATGTGKTAAFSIPLLQRIDPKKSGVQALILCPTRELAIQVAGQIDLLGKHMGVRSLPIYGGTGYGDQIYGLKNGATIVVGTPGRVIDHIEKGTLKLNSLKTLILDEADEMISMGFQEDLEKVLEAAPRDKSNIWLFSATMGNEVRHVADAYLRNPGKVQVNRTEMLPDTVEQIFYKTHEYDKPQLLCKIMDLAEDFYGIVFCQTKALVADLNQFLLSKGYRVDCLHGDLDQTARDRVMKNFREKNISILIATDVACRGLDVKDITHVVNYSIPRELDNYVHRIGRTGRSGKKGLALSFVTYSHRELIGRIERMTKSQMTEGKVPTQKEIFLKKIANVQKAFETDGPQGRTLAMMPADWKTSLEEMSKEDIAARFLTLLLPDLGKPVKEEKMADSRPAPQVKEQSSRSDRGGDRSDRGNRGDRGGRSQGGERRESRPYRGGNSSGERYRSKPGTAGSWDQGESSRPNFKPSFKESRYRDRKPSGEKSPPWERGPKRADGGAAPAWKNKVSAPTSRPESGGSRPVRRKVFGQKKWPDRPVN